MEESDFNSEEWKEKLKGKSPEEIAEIVGSYYEKKYRNDRVFSLRKVMVIIFMLLLIVGISILFFQLFSKLSQQSVPHQVSTTQ